MSKIIDLLERSQMFAASVDFQTAADQIREGGELTEQKSEVLMRVDALLQRAELYFIETDQQTDTARKILPIMIDAMLRLRAAFEQAGITKTNQWRPFVAYVRAALIGQATCSVGDIDACKQLGADWMAKTSQMLLDRFTPEPHC